MIRANKRERQFYETAYMRYIDENKFSRNVYKCFGEVFEVNLTWKLKRKFKTVQHYLIHNDEKKAREQLYQFMDEIENVNKIYTE